MVEKDKIKGLNNAHMPLTFVHSESQPRNCANDNQDSDNYSRNKQNTVKTYVKVYVIIKYKKCYWLYTRVHSIFAMSKIITILI